MSASGSSSGSSSGSTASSGSSATGSKIVATAKQHLGVPYKWGGTDPSGFDCSGLTSYVYGLKGISIGRSSRDQYARNTPIKRNQIRPGDLVFFSGSKIGSDVGHV